MIHRAVPVDEVDAAADALTAELAAAATVAVGLAKLLIHRSLTADLEHQLADEGFAMELSSRTDDFKESGRAGPRETSARLHRHMSSALPERSSS